MMDRFISLMDLVGEWMPQLLVAAGLTLQLTALSFLLATTLGLVVAFAQLSTSRLLVAVAKAYIQFLRGIPTLVLLFAIYFILPQIGIALEAFPAAVIGLGLVGSAYLAEVYRAGIQAIDRGQSEAARAIGMTTPIVMIYIVMPQAIRIIIPPMGNYLVALLKDTSIASLISAPDLMLRARDLTSEYYMPMEIYILVGLMYLAMSYPLSLGVRYVESRLGQRRTLPMK